MVRERTAFFKGMSRRISSGAGKSHIFLGYFALIRNLIVISLTGFICIQPGIAAMPQALRDAQFSYQNVPAPVTKVLEDFAQAFSLQLVTDKHIAGEVKQKIRATTAVNFLERLAFEYRFQWFIFEGKLYISSAQEQRSLKIKVSGDTVDSLKKALTDVGLLDTRFGWGELPDSAEILVSGPAEYVNLIRSFAAQPEKSKQQTAGNEAMFFPLRFAEAADRQIKYQNETLTVPGIGTILSELLIQKKNDGGLLRVYSPDVPNLARQSSQLKEKIASLVPDYSSLLLTASAEQTAAGERARVVVDARNNAILIYGDPAKRKEYGLLISKLDVPLQLIAVDTLVVDIDRDQITQAPTREGGYKRKKRISEEVINGSKTLLTTQELAKLHAEIDRLAERGAASYVVRPSLITLENSPAILHFNPQGSVSEDDPDLIGQQGTLLQITPRIIASEQSNLFQVKLGIHYGSITSPGGRDPALSGNINTLFAVREGDSLVVGGLSVHEKNSLQGIATTSKNRERFYIITPKRVYQENARQVTVNSGEEKSGKSGRKGGYSESTWLNIVRDIAKLASSGITTSVFHEADDLAFGDLCEPGWPFEIISENSKSRAASDYKIFAALIKNSGQRPASFDEADCDTEENLIIVPYSSVQPGAFTEVYVVTKNRDEKAQD